MFGGKLNGSSIHPEVGKVKLLIQLAGMPGPPHLHSEVQTLLGPDSATGHIINSRIPLCLSGPMTTCTTLIQEGLWAILGAHMRRQSKEDD